MNSVFYFTVLYTLDDPIGQTIDTDYFSKAHNPKFKKKSTFQVNCNEAQQANFTHKHN